VRESAVPAVPREAARAGSNPFCAAHFGLYSGILREHVKRQGVSPREELEWREFLGKHFFSSGDWEENWGHVFAKRVLADAMRADAEALRRNARLPTCVAPSPKEEDYLRIVNRFLPLAELPDAEQDAGDAPLAASQQPCQEELTPKRKTRASARRRGPRIQGEASETGHKNLADSAAATALLQFAVDMWVYTNSPFASDGSATKGILLRLLQKSEERAEEAVCEAFSRAGGNSAKSLRVLHEMAAFFEAYLR
jgi:hypothetical protein